MGRYVSHLIFFSVEPGKDGSVAGLDRLPPNDVLAAAVAARAAHGMKLLLCAGGNGRSSHFSRVSRSPTLRRRFAAALAERVVALGLNGVDLNWEYPAFMFGRGYADDKTVKDEWRALSLLARDVRAALPRGSTLTLAYYPDGRQESLLLSSGAHRFVDLMHAMAYDAGGAEGHSSLALAEAALRGGAAAALPSAKLTLGLPFYGRHSATGDWTTYEDLVQRHHPLPLDADAVPAPGGGGATIAFNGGVTIERKTRLALKAGWGGVMVWEVGQDCRIEPVTRGGTTHARTCPGEEGAERSLLAAIARGVAAEAGGGGGGSGAPPRSAAAARNSDEL